jgi:hypothetical protein
VNKVSQIRKVISLVSEALAFGHSLFLWESIPNSSAAYVAFVMTVLFFQAYWIPLMLLLLFLKNYAGKESNASGDVSESDEDLDSLYSSSSETSSVATSMATSKASSVRSSVATSMATSVRSSVATSMAKFAAADELVDLIIPNSVNPVRLWSKYMNGDTGRQIVSTVKTAHEQARFVQELLEFFAEIYEKVVNTFNFTVPWLSYLAILVLVAGVLVFYVLPLRMVLLVWGTYEFGKGFCGLRVFELLAFLSRVHSKHEAKMYAQTAAPP